MNNLSSYSNSTERKGREWLSPPNVSLTGFQGHRTDGDLVNGRGGGLRCGS